METDLYKYKILSKDFFSKDTIEVAKNLLGKLLIRKIGDKLLIGIINETEAYKPDDPAAHCYNNKLTQRTQALFGPTGHAYIYLNYGIHYCLNMVSYDDSVKCGGVLIRSVIPISGQDIMKQNRKVKEISENLTNGPGKLGQAYYISNDLYGINLCSIESELVVAEGYEIPNNDILKTPRIGISKAQDLLWRFIIKPNYSEKLYKQFN